MMYHGSKRVTNMRHNLTVFGVVIRTPSRRRLLEWGRIGAVALLWTGVGFHIGTSFPQWDVGGQPETLAMLVSLKQRVVELEDRWRIVVGVNGTPERQTPLPPFPWTGNAPPVPTASTTNRPR